MFPYKSTHHQNLQAGRRIVSTRRLRLERLEARRVLSADLVSFGNGDLSSKDDPLFDIVGEHLFDAYNAFNSSLNQSPGRPINNVSNSLVKYEDNGDVLVDVIASGDVAKLRSDLRNIGFDETAHFGKVVSGTIKPLLIPELAKLESVNFARPTSPSATNAGSVLSQADFAQRSIQAKSRFGVDGSGIKVGVLSDSFNQLGGAPAGIASGDLPGAGNPAGRTTPVQVLEEAPGNVQSKDEGRAMLELVHDIAPGADLAFHTSQRGSASFAQGIIDLANAGSDVIVDDVTFFDQPFFQDGIIAQAADEVASRGIPFFSSAGNQGSQSYAAPFRSSGQVVTIAGRNGYVAHDFDPGSGIDTNQSFELKSGDSLNIILQWDEPFASAGGTGSTSDLDIFIYNFNFQLLVASSRTNNIGGDPIERVVFLNDSAVDLALNVVIARDITRGGNHPSLIKYIDYAGGSLKVAEYITNSSTLYGHHNAAGGAGVAAAFYQNTPAFGVSPPQPEASTSTGGVPILFTPNGTRLNQPITRLQPRITAPDGTNTTFFSAGVDPENDGFENFFGTSAAAPHAAAVAALMLQAAGGAGSLSPEQVYTTMERTAIDMVFTGFDFVSGHGLINAELAVAAVVAPSLSIASTSASKSEGNSGSTSFTFTITRSGNLTGTSTIDYTVSGSGANPAQANDFAGGVFPTGRVSFAAGQSSRVVSIPVRGDTTVEVNEGFVVRLVNPRRASVQTATSAGLIRNDDFALLSIAATSANRPEGNSGFTNFTFTVTRSVALSSITTVNYAVSGSSANPANASDFFGLVLPAGQITFGAGETSKVIAIRVRGDSANEADERFVVTLSNPSANATITTATATGLIRNDDTAVAIAATSVSKVEGNSGNIPFTFTVTRSGLLTGPTTVNYAVTGIGTSPAAASDFLGNVLPSGTVAFTASETSKVITIRVLGDTTLESDETFRVTLSSATAGTTITTATANGTIRNDDTASLAIAATSANKVEGDSSFASFTFTVTRSGTSNIASTVNFAVTGSGANPADANDFFGLVLPTGQITFAAGETAKVISIRVRGDSTAEQDERFNVTLSSPSLGTTITNAVAAGLIRNDDV